MGFAQGCDLRALVSLAAFGPEAWTGFLAGSPVAAKALEIMGEKTGAFQAVVMVSAQPTVGVAKARASMAASSIRLKVAYSAQRNTKRVNDSKDIRRLFF